MKLILCLLLTTLSSLCVAQKVLYEYQSKSTLDDFNCVAVKDTILLTYDEKYPDKDVKKSMWISDESISSDQSGVNVHTAVNNGEEVYLYYISGKKKSRELRSFVINKEHKRSESPGAIPLPGNILGSYVEKNLFFILVDEAVENLSVLEITGMSVASEKKFRLPFKLQDFKPSTPAEFFSDHSGINAFKGIAQVKAFKYGDIIYLTIDAARGITLVTKFDLKTNGVKFDSFNADTIDPFGSYVLDGKLFRVYNNKAKFLTTIVDLETRQTIASSELLPPETDFNVYFRYGSKDIISHKATFRQMMKISPVSIPSIVVSKSPQGSYIIQWGSYYNRDQSTVYLPGPSIAGLIGAVLANVVFQMRDRPGITRYFNYEWDQTTFKVRDFQTELLQEKIDKFEIDNHPRVKHKSYIDYKNGVAAVYYVAKTHKVSVVYFE